MARSRQRVHLHMETTKVEVSKTCAEIEEELVAHGATQVFKSYDTTRQVDALEFAIPIEGQDVYFKLPFRWQSIQRMTSQGRTGNRNTAKEDQARRVAARLVLRWVQAQFALVQTGMVKTHEVFMPYITAKGGQTYYEQLESTGMLKAIGAGQEREY